MSVILERFVNRLASGYTSAGFMFSDYRNKGEVEKDKKQKSGKPYVESDTFAVQKGKQELLSTSCEAAATLGIMCLLGKYSKTKWLPIAACSTVTLGSNIYSRYASNMSLTRNKTPDALSSSFKYCEKLGKNSVYMMHPDMQPQKNPILTLKNILYLCAASIVVCASLRFAKENFGAKFNKTYIGKGISSLKQMYRNHTVEKVWGSKSELNNLTEMLKKLKEKELVEEIKETFVLNPNKRKFFLGERKKTVKPFGIEMPVHKLYENLIAPLKFIKEFVSYPYKKIEPVFSKQLKKEMPELKDIFLEYKQLQTKYKDPIKLEAAFAKYFKEKSGFNDVFSLSAPISAICSLIGIHFQMTDEFNSSRDMGKSKAVSEKDAKLRGLNKFTRMATQVMMIGIFNETFKKQYNGSLLGVAVITVGCTIFTDILCRILTGMPFKHMSAEKQAAYQQKQKNSRLTSGYFKLIDRLSD